MTYSFSIDPGHPALPGHFPGNPVVPGVVLLEQLIVALEAAHPGRTCIGVRRMKFLRPLRAGERVAVTFGEPKTDAVTVKALVGAEPLAEGRLSLAPV